MQQIILSAFADEAAIDLATQLQALQANQLQAVDLRAVDGVNIADFSPDMTSRIRLALARAGIAVACLASPIGKIGITDPFPPHLEKMKRLGETAGRLDCPRIRIFSFYLPDGQPAARFRDEVLERLDRLLLAAADAGVRLLHENEKGIFGDLPERCLDLHQVFGSRLGGILDPANYLQVGGDPLAAMVELNQWIEYLHIKDCRISDGKIVPAGHGDGQVAAIIRLFLTRPDRVHIAVEPHLYSFTGLELLQKADASLAAAESASGADKARLAGEIADPAQSAFATAITACRNILDSIQI